MGTICLICSVLRRHSGFGGESFEGWLVNIPIFGAF